MLNSVFGTIKIHLGIGTFLMQTCSGHTKGFV